MMALQEDFEELDERALAAAEWVNKEIRKLIDEIKKCGGACALSFVSWMRQARPAACLRQLCGCVWAAVLRDGQRV